MHLSGRPADAPLALIKPLFDHAMRDPSMGVGPDGMYYLTGTTGNNPAGGHDKTGWWYLNEGIRLWQSKDLNDWEPLGLVWSLEEDATWARAFESDGKGHRLRACWAPELHYLRGTFWLTYCMNYQGCGLLRSVSGEARGPYVDVKPDEPLSGEIDASMFEDDDGMVYWVYQNGKIAPMSDDMTSLASKAGLLLTDNHEHVGFEGAFVTKHAGRYILICAEFNDRCGTRTYDCMAASSDKLMGPYGPRYLAIPHGGHNTLFGDHRGQWFSTFFGNDARAAFTERPGILPIRFDGEGRIFPLLATSVAPRAEVS